MLCVNCKGGYVMEYLFIEYPKCSTCKKAKKWLDDHKISYKDRHIVENNPTVEEIGKWYEMSNMPLKKFFNTSGLKYKELNLKDKLGDMTTEEQIKLLATDGMLLKRPLLIGRDFVVNGFKEDEWMEVLKDAL